jgi:hypothetical protein
MLLLIIVNLTHAMLSTWQRRIRRFWLFEEILLMRRSYFLLLADA